MNNETAPPCPGESFLHWETTEDGDWRIQIACNGGEDGDCGWFCPLDLDSTDGLTSEDLNELYEAHEAYRAFRAHEVSGG